MNFYAVFCVISCRIQWYFPCIPLIKLTQVAMSDVKILSPVTNSRCKFWGTIFFLFNFFLLLFFAYLMCMMNLKRTKFDLYERYKWNFNFISWGWLLHPCLNLHCLTTRHHYMGTAVNSMLALYSLEFSCGNYF